MMNRRQMFRNAGAAAASLVVGNQPAAAAPSGWHDYVRTAFTQALADERGITFAGWGKGQSLLDVAYERSLERARDIAAETRDRREQSTPDAEAAITFNNPDDWRGHA